MSDVKITFGHESVGTVRFVQPEGGLTAVRTASGFRVQLPASITLASPLGSGLPLVLQNLLLTIYAAETSKQLEIGIACCDSIFTTPMQDAPVHFLWDLTFEATAFCERLRAGREPKFGLQLQGDISYILVAANAGRTGKEPVSVPTRFYEHGEVGYSRQAWTKMMRDVGVTDSVLVEIPFASDPPSEWEPVWNAFQDARDSFDSGGLTGWKNAVTSVRLALEEWRKIEKEDQGPGWQSPKMPDLQSRTKSQRIDNIRWHLIQLAHYAAHTKADEWTRDDALLLLSTLSSLLAVRNP